MKVVNSFLLILFLSVTLLGRYHRVTNERKYYDFINDYQYAVICFVDSKQEFIDRSEKKDYSKSLSLFKKALKAASVSGNYKKFLKKEVGFLLVDVSKRSAQELDDPFYFSELPSCILLEDGEPIDENGKMVQINGFSTKRDVLDFLDKNIRDDLDEIVDEKKELLEQERAERIARLEAYRNYPLGIWSPYYYSYRTHPYYRNYGHVGFGIVL